MIGGLVFLPLSLAIYDPKGSTKSLKSWADDVKRQFKDEEVVILNQILPHRKFRMWHPLLITDASTTTTTTTMMTHQGIIVSIQQS